MKALFCIPMRPIPPIPPIAPIAIMALLVGCGAGGSGTARFTTWGEAYIEDEIPAAEFIDGWTIKFGKFLVAFHDIEIANTRGEVAATMSGSRLVDNVQPGRKDLVSFPGLRAEAWDAVGYQIEPPAADADLVSATAADRDLMISGGLSIYVEGTATKDAVSKTFHWGFPIATRYSDCEQSEDEGGRLGIVVTNGGTDTSELTTHGDHFFYDRLQASPSTTAVTSLRFDAMAAADTNGDGEVTMAELDAQTLDVTKYNPSPFTVTTLGGFVTSLARTVGHFRGEGECSVAPITP
jgi:hypothetical protein